LLVNEATVGGEFLRERGSPVSRKARRDPHSRWIRLLGQNLRKYGGSFGNASKKELASVADKSPGVNREEQSEHRQLYAQLNPLYGVAIIIVTGWPAARSDRDGLRNLAQLWRWSRRKTSTKNAVG